MIFLRKFISIYFIEIYQLKNNNFVLPHTFIKYKNEQNLEYEK